MFFDIVKNRSYILFGKLFFYFKVDFVKIEFVVIENCNMFRFELDDLLGEFGIDCFFCIGD